jgi:electron transport complex protein RnfG
VNPRHILASAGLLALFALLGTALVAAIQDSTAERIEANERAALLRQLNEIVPPELHDNDLAGAVEELEAEALDPAGRTTIYRSLRDEATTALVFEVVAPDGYSGPIRLLVGVDAGGTLLGARVLAHQETPGLGDAIEARRSDWIRGFAGRSLGDPPAPEWAVRRDGGAFDQFTGATVTPRAVVGAIKRTLIYFATHRERLLGVATANPPETNPSDTLEENATDG